MDCIYWLETMGSKLFQVDKTKRYAFVFIGQCENEEKVNEQIFEINE